MLCGLRINWSMVLDWHHKLPIVTVNILKYVEGLRMDCIFCQLRYSVCINNIANCSSTLHLFPCYTNNIQKQKVSRKSLETDYSFVKLETLCCTIFVWILLTLYINKKKGLFKQLYYAYSIFSFVKHTPRTTMRVRLPLNKVWCCQLIDVFICQWEQLLGLLDGLWLLQNFSQFPGCEVC